MRCFDNRVDPAAQNLLACNLARNIIEMTRSSASYSSLLFDYVEDVDVTSCFIYFFLK